MRKFFAILLIALIALSIAACGGKGKERPLPAGSVVVALGDSITQGVGASEQSAWPALLARLSGWQVLNAGVSSDTSAQALARLPVLLQEHKPALVIVSIGGNDFLRRQPASATRANIAAILRTAKESGSRVVLIGVPKLTSGAALGIFSDHELYEELAKEHGVPLLSDAWGDVMKQSRLMSDQIHPNATGYAEFTASLEKFLRKQGFLR
ncbi:arylesterase [Campylobacter showae]|jgi:triacylglycerol lipase|uniref:arylesterase n=1 Tax=Campylobacter showae TaxID=204 RepID=UPI000F092240|nr:arylesterase [Campylobacter showae]